MATVIKADNLKDQNVIAELNTKIANKEVIYLRIYNENNLLFGVATCDYDYVIIKSNNVFISVTSLKPYFYTMFFFEEFTGIVVSDKIVFGD